MSNQKELALKALIGVLTAIVLGLFNDWREQRKARFEAEMEAQKAQAEVFDTLDSYRAYIQSVLSEGCNP